MTDNFIQIKKDNRLRIGIKDAEGNDTGEQIIFDFEDVELPLRLQKSLELHKKNVQSFKNQMLILSKKQDKKGKKLLSYKEEEEIKLVKEYYENEIYALDLFIGEGKTRTILKLMNREPYFQMFDDIGELLEPLMPVIEKNIKSSNEIIEEKYKQLGNNILRNE